MKKLFSILIALVMIVSLTFVLTACPAAPIVDGNLTYRDAEFKSTLDPLNLASGSVTASNWKVVMVTDYGDITDQSFNQATYEGSDEFCKKYGISFAYAKPANNSTAARVSTIRSSISGGANVIVMPGYAFGEAIYEVVDDYPDVYFIALDVAAGDLQDAIGEEEWTLPNNVFCAVYQEEFAGFMAGYAAVKEGYRKLGFLGGMAVPAVVRYGSGFVQGANKAAVELGVNIVIEYVYSGVFWQDPDVNAVMATWYGTKGVEVIFACGGGVFISACEEAVSRGGKVIGVDVDQAPIIDGMYGEGMTVTSAMKGLAATVQSVLAELVTGGWANFGGAICTLGLVSGTDVEANFVQLPIATWSMENFSVADYKALVAKLYNGEIAVSNSTSERPTVDAGKVTITYYDDIK